MLNAFTVDVEDYYHVSAFESDIDREDWPKFESRVGHNVDRLLDLLDVHGVKGTFFVLGWVADHFPEVVRAIDARGHEIGCHSYWHRLIYRQTPADFREDLRRSRDTIANLIGRPVVAYRAPSFSITKKSLWALEILVEEGFQFDSSIFPTRHDRYGIPDAEPRIHKIETPSGDLWEFPPSIVRLLGINIPVSGGGYFRLEPWPLLRRLLGRVNHCAARPFVFYIHPWELDPSQPRLRAGSRIGRFRHYLNLSIAEAKLRCLLGMFAFTTLRAALDSHIRTALVSTVTYEIG